MFLYQVCLNGNPKVQNGPAPGGPGLNHKSILKTIQRSSSLLKFCEVCPGEPVPSLFKWQCQSQQGPYRRRGRGRVVIGLELGLIVKYT